MSDEVDSRYETHITLDAQNVRFLEDMPNWTYKRGMKWTQIELDGGKTPLQPMVSFRSSGTKQKQIECASKLSKEFAEIGIDVVRVKVELELPYNRSSSEIQIKKIASKEYFEHHLKLLLSTDAEFDFLRTTIHPFNARLSRNARRQRTDGLHERFVTQRLFDASTEVSRTILEDLVTELKKNNVTILEVERELVVYDSNLELDSGWMTHK